MHRMMLVDARGHRCPTPTLRLRRALARLKAGEVVTLLADDPMARIDVPHFARAAGHAVVDLTEADGALRFEIVKGAEPGS